MHIHCTKKLLDQLAIRPEQEIEETPDLFSWHANLLMLNRKKVVVLVNDLNRYMVILYGLKAKDFKKLDKLLVEAVREVFEQEGIKESVLDRYFAEAGEVVFTKTKNRTYVARLNQSTQPITSFFDFFKDSELVQTEASLRLGRFLVGDGKGSYYHPHEAMLEDLEKFMGEPIISNRAVKLKVKLGLQSHSVWRQLIVPTNYSFNRFHQVLQEAFGWTNRHLYEFQIYKKPTKKLAMPHLILVPEEEMLHHQNQIPMKLTTGVLIEDYLYNVVRYLYDFGDHWEHEIEFGEVVEDYDKNYPLCLDGEGERPPEDVGGELGYEEYLSILADHSHPAQKELLGWDRRDHIRREFEKRRLNIHFKSYWV